MSSRSPGSPVPVKGYDALARDLQQGGRRLHVDRLGLAAREPAHEAARAHRGRTLRHTRRSGAASQRSGRRATIASRRSSGLTR